MSAMQQLREELYQVAQRKLKLESELNSLNSFIQTLKKELTQRMPGA